jgi:hypothetical protein
MARRILLVLLAILACAAAPAWSQGRKVVGEWDYVYYNNDGKPTGAGIVQLLREGDAHKLRFTAQTDLHVCLRRDLPAKVAKEGGKTVVTAPSELHSCPSFRLVLNPDGTGGVREMQAKSGEWRADGKDRSLRALRANAPAAGPGTQPVAAAGPRLRARALVIGNSAYASFGRLPNPRNDAEAIAAKLRSFGIETQVALDADRDAMAKALNDFATEAAASDVNILFYAGHGVQVDGTNYLVPVNLKAEGLSPAAIKLNTIALNTALEAMPARVRIVFLDACRDNPVGRQLVATRGGAVGLAPVTINTSGTLIAYSTRDGATAEDGKGKHSPYTSALLEHLGRPQDIAVVLRHVRESVMKATGNRQEPWEYGSLVGDQLVLAKLAR